ncbi:hypothetical protein B0H12DRAFT_36573 [Mycena haematopus]|nr:hypothetical protein B0H12DRAFT_36573 [Mycena haematopus]
MYPEVSQNKLLTSINNILSHEFRGKTDHSPKRFRSTSVLAKFPALFGVTLAACGLPAGAVAFRHYLCIFGVKPGGHSVLR